jgi:methionine synthase I (cobalamin-dependent)
VLTRPDVIEQIHRDYFEAGADVVETDSFTASRLKLDEYGLGARRTRSTSPRRSSRAAPPTRSRRPSGRASSPARSDRPGC